MSGHQRGGPAGPPAREAHRPAPTPSARSAACTRLTAGPAPADLGARALAAARRGRRARGAWALSAVGAITAVLVTGLLVPRGEDPGATPGTALAAGAGDRLSRGGGPAADALLPLGAVRTVLPGASVSVPPTDLSGSTFPAGYCQNPLPPLLLPPGGPPGPTAVWAAEWSREVQAGVDPAGADGVGSVREEVLRWPGAASAVAYTHAVRQSPTTCPDPRDGGFPGTVYTPLALDERSDAADTPPPADDSGGPLLSLAAARAGASVPGTPTWRVRAVFARDATAVSLTTVLRAADAAAAARSTLRLLDLALDRAVVAAPASPAALGARAGDRDGPSPGTGAAAGPDGAAAPVLGTEQVVAAVPGLRALGAPVRLAPPTAGPGVLVGGWCSGPLRDVPLPGSVWFARWARPEARPAQPAGGPPVLAGVEQTLLRFDAPDGARAYADATSRSAGECPLTGVSPGYTVQPGRADLPRRTVAVGPGAASGSWSVRVTDVRGTTVVVLAVFVPAPDADAATAVAQGLLDAALDRAGRTP